MYVRPALLAGRHQKHEPVANGASARGDRGCTSVAYHELQRQTRLIGIGLDNLGARMSGPIKVIMVGKWSVGFSKSDNLAILSFQFEDHASINLALQPDQAALMAAAIQDKLRSLPKSKR